MKPRVEWLVIAILAVIVALLVVQERDAEREVARAPATVPLPPIEVADLLDVDPAAPSPWHVDPPLERPLLPARSLSRDLPETGQWRGPSRLVDLDGDGHLDIVTSIRRWDRQTPAEGLMVYRGDGTGGWQLSVDGMRRDMGYGGSDVADIDGDGDLDIAFSGHDVTPHVFLAEGPGRWRAERAGLDLEVICADVAVGDADRDGLPDLAALGFYHDGGGLYLFAGVGGGTFVRLPDLLSPGHYGAQVEMFDLDGDGHLEIAATTSIGVRAWRFDGRSFIDISDGMPSPQIGGSELGLDARDLDGDGALELLVAGMVYREHDPLRIHRWDGEAWSRWGAGLPTDETCFDAVFADLEGDGRPYIVTAGRKGIGIIRMTGPGTFECLGRLEGTEGVVNVAVGDVTGDGRDEILYVGFGGLRVLEPGLGAILGEGEAS